MNLDLKKIKNPFQKFLSNILLGVFLVLISFGGTMFGSQIFNSNNIEQDVEAAGISGHRAWITQKVHYNSKGETASNSEKYPLLITEENKWVYLSVVNLDDQGRIETQTSDILEAGKNIPPIDYITAYRDTPYPAYTGNSVMWSRGLQVKYQYNHFKPVYARNYGSFGVTNSVEGDGATGGAAAFIKNGNEWFVSSNFLPEQVDLTASGQLKHRWEHTEQINGETINYYQEDYNANDLWASGTEWIIAMEGLPVTISYDANGGSGASSSKTAYFNEYFPKVSVPTKSGYTFAGYYTAKTGGTQIYDSNGLPATKCEFESNTTLYAQWIVGAAINIKLYKNDGTTSYTSMTVKYGEIPSQTVSVPTRTGYTFTGYYTQSTSGYAVFSSTGVGIAPCTVTSLYAQWTKESDKIMLYNLNDSSSSLNNYESSNLLYLANDLPSQLTYNKNTNIFTINGKVSDWQTVLGYTSLMTFSSGDQFHVVYEYLGGSISNSNTNYTSVSIETVNADLSEQTGDSRNVQEEFWTKSQLTPSSTGSKLLKIYRINTSVGEKKIRLRLYHKDNGASTFSNFKFRISVYKYNSSRTSSNAKFAPFGVNLTKASTSVYPDSPVMTFVTGYYSSYTFDGWWTAPEGGIKVEKGNSYTSREKSVFQVYAHWKKNVTLTYNANGGTMSGSSTKTVEAIAGEKYSKENKYDTASVGFKEKNSNITISSQSKEDGTTYKVKYTGTDQWFNFYTNAGMSGFAASTTYTVVVYVSSYSFSNSYFEISFANTDDSNNLDYSSSSAIFEINATGVYTKTFTTRSSNSTGNNAITNSFHSYINLKTTSSKTIDCTFNVKIYKGTTLFLGSTGTNYVPTATRTDYKNLGWATTKGDYNTIVSSTDLVPTSNQTLYAFWESYITVNIVNNYSFAGNITGSSSSGKYASLAGLTLKATANSGFTLKGWRYKYSDEDTWKKATISAFWGKWFIPSHKTEEAKTITVEPIWETTITLSETTNCAASSNNFLMNGDTETSSMTYTWNSSVNNIELSVKASPSGYICDGIRMGSSVSLSTIGQLYVGTKTETQVDGVSYYTYSISGDDLTNIITNYNSKLIAVYLTNMTVSFNSNASGVSNPSSKSVVYGKEYGTLSNLSRTGYSFKGWWTQASGGTQVLSTTKVTRTSNHTLYAHWEGNKVTVSFNSNASGVSNPSSVTVTYGSEYGTLPTVSRTNYNFLGWWTQASGGTQVLSTTKVTNTSNHTLYAHWEQGIITLTITFDANGGSTPSITTKTVTYGSAYGSLATVSRTGYTFVGWFLTKAGGTMITSATKVENTQAHTLYAHWQKDVTFNANTGSFSLTKEVTTSDKSAHSIYPLKYDGTYYMSSNNNVHNSLSLYKYTFITTSDNQTVDFGVVNYAESASDYAVFGILDSDLPYSKWTYTESTFGTTDNNTTTGLYKTFKNKSQSAEQTVSYTVETAGEHYFWFGFRKDYYTNSHNDCVKIRLTLDVEETTTTCIEGETLVLPQNPIKPGYTFTGWWTQESGGTKVTDTTTFGETLTYYAHWSANQIVVTFDSNGGSTPNPTTKTVSFDSNYGTLPTVTKKYHRNDGWYNIKASLYGKSITSSTKMIYLTNHTIYARLVSSLSFTGKTMTVATKDVAYSDSFSEAKFTTGETDTFTYSISSVYFYANSSSGSSLSATNGKYNGLSLSGLTISGTPTAMGKYSFSIKVTGATSGLYTYATMYINTYEMLSTPSLAQTLTYNGSAQTASFNNYDSSKLTIGGTTSATNAGSYTATFTPIVNSANNRYYKWSDGTITAKNVSWSISKRTLTVKPNTLSKTYGTQDPTLTYTYSNNVSGQTPKFSGALARTSGENVGTYAINKGTLALSDNGTFLASNYTLSVSSANFSITKATLLSPNVSVDSSGKITWAEIAGATSYDVSIADGTWHTGVTSGVNYNDEIVAQTGNRKITVRANSTSANYTAPSLGSKTVDVYTLTLSKGTGISAVSGAGNYISGRTVTITATATTGYAFTNWTGDITSTSASTTVVMDANKSATANASANYRSVTLNPNGGSLDNQTDTVTKNGDITQTLEINKPTRTGHIFGGWLSMGTNYSTEPSTAPGTLSSFGYALKDEADFSTKNHFYVYNNKQNGSVTHTRVADSTNPVGSGYSLKITTNGEAAPYAGGYINQFNSKAGYTFYQFIWAKIPVGYHIISAGNGAGDGETNYFYNFDTNTWVGGGEATAGTGEWKLYLYRLVCGTTGSFSTYGHKFISADSSHSNTDVTWYVGYDQIYAVKSDTDTSIVAGNGNLNKTTYLFGLKDNKLVAAWEPIRATITLNNQSATTAGTASFYAKYGRGNFSDATVTNKISSITVPTKTGCTFGGYYTMANGGGSQIINASGTILSNTFAGDSNAITLYAKWITNQSTIKLGTKTNISKVEWSTSLNGTYTELTTDGFVANANQSYYFKATIPDEVGYTKTFSGWSGWFSGTTNPSGAQTFTASGQTYTVNAEATKTANVYTASFDANGGNLSDSTRAVKYNGTYGENINLFDMSASNFNSLGDNSISGNKFVMNVDNTTGTSERYANFFSKPSNKIVPNKTYTYVIEVLSWTGGYALTMNLGKTANNQPSQLDYTCFSISQAGVYYKTVTSLQADSYYSMGRDFITIPTGKKLVAEIRVSLYAGTQIASQGADFEYVAYNNAASSSLPVPTKTGYTFDGWRGINLFNKNNYLLTSNYSSSSYSPYYYAPIKLEANTTYVVSVYRKNGYLGKNGYLLLSDMFIINNNWTAISHASQPDASLVNYVYTTDSDGLIYIGYSAISQADLNTIWANTDVVIRKQTGNLTGGSFNSTTENYADGYEPFVSTDIVTSSTIVSTAANHTLYAVWTANKVVVTFNANGGSADTTSKTVTYNSAYGTLPTATRNYHTFAGWWTARTGGEQVVESTIVLRTENHTLYARWTEKTVKVVVKKGSNVESVVDTSGTYTFGQVVSLNATVEEGYHFVSWSCSPTKTIDYATSANTSYMITEDDINAGGTLTFTSSAEINTYLINYWSKTDGDVESVDTASVVYGSLLENVGTSEYYDISGWFADYECLSDPLSTLSGEQIYSKPNGSTINLFRKLTPKTYTITYYLNGTDSVYKTETYTYGSAKSLISKNYVLHNVAGNLFNEYLFYGWFDTEPSGDLKKLESITSLLETDSGDKAFYAKFFKARAQGVEGYSDSKITINVSLGDGLKSGGNYGTILVEFFDEELGYNRNYTMILTNGTIVLDGLKYADIKITIKTNLNAKTNNSSILVSTSYKSSTTVNVAVSKVNHNGYIDIGTI